PKTRQESVIWHAAKYWNRWQGWPRSINQRRRVDSEVFCFPPPLPNFDPFALVFRMPHSGVVGILDVESLVVCGVVYVPHGFRYGLL
ncbi:hypothetical protein CEXT_63221, partial [Caerostris extrusa]